MPRHATHNVRNHLHLGNEAYDEAIRRFIPGYEAMLTAAAEAVASAHPERVVDLGAGTGALSEFLLGRCADATVELLDVDPEMLDQARVRLDEFGDRVRYTLRSFSEALEPCEAVAASLALHHIPTIEKKAALYRNVFDALPTGGVFVNADCSMPEDPAERTILFRTWADHMVARGIDNDRAWRYFDEWAEEDTYLPLEEERAALHATGFETSVAWTMGPMNVLVASKP